MVNRRNPVARETRTIGFILLLALVHGLIYVFLVPPWQHYDEPNHFEYVWLTANLDRLPKPGDYDPGLSRRVVESMLVNGFFDGTDIKPELDSSDEPVVIWGYSQLSEPPLYYVLASLPLRLLPSVEVDYQLYATRLVSLLLYLITIMVTWGVAREITPMGNPLRWMMPLTLALLPAFVDLMTAANNDGIAVVVVSLFLWSGVRLVRRGFSLLDFTLVVGMTVASYFSKNIAMLIIILFPIVVLFTVLRGKWRILAWTVIGSGIVVVMLIVFSWGDAVYWYHATSQVEPTRESNQKAVLGDHVLRINTHARVLPLNMPPLFQPIPIEVGKELRGKQVTLGAWIWASQPAEISSPILKVSSRSSSEMVGVDEEPKFFAMSIEIPQDTSRVWVGLSPKPDSSSDVHIYYDGLVLALGQRTTQEPPRFDSPDGSRGFWGGEPFVNLLRNGSAEDAGPRIHPFVDQLGAKILPDNSRPSLLLTSLYDLSVSGPMYSLTVQRLFQTFWAQFGWANVPLIGDKPYHVLVVFTIIAVLGAVICVLRRWNSLSRDVLFFLSIALFLSWSTTFTRGASFMYFPRHYTPVARHTFPVIIPAILLLTAGWLQIFDLVSDFFHRATHRGIWPLFPLPAFQSPWLQKFQIAAFFLFLIVLDLLSVLSIARFYGKI